MLHPITSVHSVLFASLILATAVAPVVAKSPQKKGKTAEKPTVVKLFDGIKSGDLKVRVIPKNEFESKVWVTNTTAKPLTVHLPKAVAAVQVLKQLQLPGGLQNPFQQNNGVANNNQNGGQAQSVGGNFAGGNNQQFGNNLFPQNGQNPLGPGFFSVPSQKSVSLSLHTVCLEHGKPTPHAHLAYELRPVDDVVTEPALRRILADYNPQKDDRMTLQAAAWHLASDMSWKDLQAKSQRRLGGLGPKRVFSRKQLYFAFEIVKAAKSAENTDDEKPVRVTSRSVR